jgi:hypothetical protein
MLPESKLNPAKMTVYFGKQQTKAVMPGVCTLAGAFMQFEYQQD